MHQTDKKTTYISCDLGLKNGIKNMDQPHSHFMDAKQELMFCLFVCLFFAFRIDVFLEFATIFSKWHSTKKDSTKKEHFQMLSNAPLYQAPHHIHNILVTREKWYCWAMSKGLWRSFYGASSLQISSQLCWFTFITRVLF